jgi:predicted nucleic acid-binding protein
LIAVDSNIIVYLLVPGPGTAAAQSLLQREGEWVAPVLWRSEVRNVLAGYMRRGELLFEEAIALNQEAEDLMRECEYQIDTTNVLDLVRSSDCSAYDCEYVALAKQLRVRLVTMDREVLRAFPEVAVPLVHE